MFCPTNMQVDTWIFIWIVGLALFFTVSAVKDRVRKSAIRQMAARVGFIYLGDAVPRVNLDETPFRWITSAWNVIAGERCGIDVVAFDCRVGQGKGSWRRTVIAARTQDDIFSVVAFDRNLTVDRSGNWMVLYQPKQPAFVPGALMQVEELEAHLNAIKQ